MHLECQREFELGHRRVNHADDLKRTNANLQESVWREDPWWRAKLSDPGRKQGLACQELVLFIKKITGRHLFFSHWTMNFSLIGKKDSSPFHKTFKAEFTTLLSKYSPLSAAHVINCYLHYYRHQRRCCSLTPQTFLPLTSRGHHLPSLGHQALLYQTPSTGERRATSPKSRVR